jgi:hypothetical protein
VVENDFGILKTTFQKFLGEIEMDITLVLNIFTSCFLHNLIFCKKELNIQRLLQVLELETTQDIQRNIYMSNVKVHLGLEGLEHFGEQHQRQLEIYLTSQ